MSQTLPTKEERYAAAIRRARTLAAKHAAKGLYEKAYKTLRRGTVNAERWLNGTHPQQHLTSS